MVTFLDYRHLDWRNIQLADLEDFAHWLRVGDTLKVVSMQPVEAKRAERSVNRATSAVTTFYEYHIASKTVDFKQFERFYLPYGLARKGLLTGIAIKQTQEACKQDSLDRVYKAIERLRKLNAKVNFQTIAKEC